MEITSAFTPGLAARRDEPAMRSAATESLAATVHAMGSWSHEPAGDRWQYHQVTAGIDRLCADIIRCELAGCPRKEIDEILRPVQQHHLRSPLIRRLATWPRGYRGDFETVDYLWRAQNQAPPRTMEYHLEEYALNCAAAQQHRNKLCHQAALLLEAFEEHQAPRIMSLACGACLDLQLIQARIAGREGHLLLSDTDPEALRSAEEALQPPPARCQFVCANPLHLVRSRHLGGDFDLIAAGGLFDYLPERTLCHLLCRLYAHWLAPGGKLFFTNVAKGNPYRPWMEYIADWVVIERSEDEIRRLCRLAGVEQSSIRLTRESTGLTILCEITRPRG